MASADVKVVVDKDKVDEEKAEVSEAAKDSSADENATKEESAAAAAAEAEDKDNEMMSTADGTERSRRVYVGNLSWGITWRDLKDHMSSTGLEVTRANIMLTPDGRSKGCGIVEFATPEAAQQSVLTLNDSELAGRQIFVREDREERSSSFSTDEKAKGRRVYVGNLSWDVAWQNLKDHMRQAGEVVHAEVIMEHTGRSKGCGIVEYATVEEAQEAIRTLTDTDLKGRMIFVREDRETSSQSGGGGGGPKVQNTSVYVRNLSPEVTWQTLKDHMRQAGNVDSATILMNANGESTGSGLVVYQRPQDAARAIRELQNSELLGSPIMVREDRAYHHHAVRGGGHGFRRGGAGRERGGRGRGRGSSGRGSSSYHEGTQLYVGNLSSETTWRELKDFFRQCGDVKHAEVKLQPDGTSKGFGIVQFFQKAEADEAIKRLNGSELQGRQLEVRLNNKSRF